MVPVSSKVEIRVQVPVSARVVHWVVGANLHWLSLSLLPSPLRRNGMAGQGREEEEEEEG